VRCDRTGIEYCGSSPNTIFAQRRNLLSATFFFSSLMNYLLATLIVTSPTGSAAFNEELGRMTLLSYPVIAIPSTVMLTAILYYIWRTINDMTGLSLEELMISGKRNTRAD
jgi:hypothetical protein